MPILKYVRVLLAVLAGLFAALSTHAETLTLAEWATDEFAVSVPGSITSMGFTIGSWLPDYPGRLSILGRNNPGSINPGGASVVSHFSGDTVLISRVDGGVFSFNSISMADFSNVGVSATVTFTFWDMNNTSSTQTLAMDSQVGAQNFNFERTDLSKVSFALTSGGWVQFADVNVAPVPEPETYAMLLAGLGVIGAFARRRKARTQGFDSSVRNPQ